MTTRIVEDIFDGISEPTRFERIKWRISHYISETRYFFEKLYERYKYGFPVEQAWDFCSHHSLWVVPRLKHLRANLHGHPGGLVEGEWEAILDKMIWAFENWENDPPPIYPENYDHRMTMEDDGEYKIFTRLDQRPLDYTPHHEHIEKCKQGFALFGEYYMNLWD